MLYLYGAAVQGIQEFIFQTNKLREIVGASELVERICTDLFAEVLFGTKPEIKKEKDPVKKRELLMQALKDNKNAVSNAAGNIKYIFDSEEECRRVVKIFPKTVMEFAPGITISQSVVKMESEDAFKDAVMKLEMNLRTQRNKHMRDLSLGLTGILRSRETGLPVTHIRSGNNDKEYLDSATFHKLFDERGVRKETFTLLCGKAFGYGVGQDRLPLDVKDMTDENDWIAIIHADGNGLGQIIQKIGTDKDTFREFSRRLDEATTAAARQAFSEVVAGKAGKNGFIPMRPIVLSGDDITVICRGDIAIPYTEAFLRYFEAETEERLQDILSGKRANGAKGDPIFEDDSVRLSACAGIAFIKSSFPFHFGYHLAESLCERAKKDTKSLFNAAAGNLPASCLMFHKVQDSFITDFKEIAERELTPQKGISFEYGPYYFKDYEATAGKRWKISDLTDNVALLNGKDGNAVKSHLREWLTLIHENPGMADQKIGRLIEIAPEGMKNFIQSIAVESDGSSVRTESREDKDKQKYDVKVYPVYDILAIHTINNQKTR